MATAAEEISYELRLLDEGDSCGALKLGEPELTPLKIFLKRHAKRFHRTNLARTFVVVESGKTTVIAYVTLLCTQIRVAQLNGGAGEDEFPYDDYPALRLARLAVDARHQKVGLGGRIVDFVMSLAKDQIMPNAGCRFLILDAKPGSVTFYEKKGFSKIGDVPDGNAPHALMFVDLHRLR